MYDTILVPTDGSDAADAAVEAALALAKRFDASLHAIHVLEVDELPEDVDAGTRRELEGRIEAVLAGVADRAGDADVPASTDIVETTEPVHRAIVDAADEQGVDLVVMGTHGRTGLHQLVLGSVTERTLRLSPVPVLTVHEETTLDPELDEVLVPTDGSDTATAAADHAIALTAETGGALHVIHVVDVTGFWSDIDSAQILDALEEAGKRAVDTVADRADEQGVRSVEVSILSGTPARSIVEYVETRDVDLVVVGTHGRTGLDRFLLGSVAEKVVRVADTPVLTVSSSGDR